VPLGTKKINKYHQRSFSICEKNIYGFAIALCNTKYYLYKDGIARLVWESEAEDFFWKSQEEAEAFLNDFLDGQIEVETVELVIDGVKSILSKVSVNVINKIIKEQSF